MSAAEHKYLGTDLAPAEYYRQHAACYVNPHAKAVGRILMDLTRYLHGHVLDIGCGDGLATKLLKPLGFTCLGVDRSWQMVERYRAETTSPGDVAAFGDVLPKADSAVASYALHLAVPAELAVFWSNLSDAGVDVLVIVSPFKSRPAPPEHYFKCAETIRGNYGPDGKTVHGAAFVKR